MALHRLEVYVDSYRTNPFVKEFDDGITLSPRDEQELEDWIGQISGKRVRIDQHLRIEDIKHHCLDKSPDIVQATSIRVSIVD